MQMERQLCYPKGLIRIYDFNFLSFIMVFPYICIPNFRTPFLHHQCMHFKSRHLALSFSDSQGERLRLFSAISVLWLQEIKLSLSSRHRGCQVMFVALELGIPFPENICFFSHFVQHYNLKIVSPQIPVLKV